MYETQLKVFWGSQDLNCRLWSFFVNGFSVNLKEVHGMIRKAEQTTYWCAHKSLSVETFPGGCYWVLGAKRKPENGEMWFSCKSRPQRCIFQHKDVFPDRRDVFSNYTPSHFTHQPGASWVYWLPKSRKTRLEIIIGKTSHGKGHWSRSPNCC